MDCANEKQELLPSVLSSWASSPAPLFLSCLGEAIRWAAWLWGTPPEQGLKNSHVS